MGRGDRSTVRWKNDRVRKKKARDRRSEQSADEAKQETDRPSGA